MKKTDVKSFQNQLRMSNQMNRRKLIKCLMISPAGALPALHAGRTDAELDQVHQDQIDAWYASQQGMSLSEYRRKGIKSPETVK